MGPVGLVGLEEGYDLSYECCVIRRRWRWVGGEVA